SVRISGLARRAPKIPALAPAADRELRDPGPGRGPPVDAAFAWRHALRVHAPHSRSTTHRPPPAGTATGVRASWPGRRRAPLPGAASRKGYRVAPPSQQADTHVAPSLVLHCSEPSGCLRSKIAVAVVTSRVGRR